jgi:hypothetical protein
MAMKLRNDITGSIFGRLCVVNHAGKNKHGKSQWLCSCSCGNTLIISHGNLITGNTESCGCLHKEGLLTRITTHGHRYEPVYISWTNMISRCNNPKNKRFTDYGGRGITVCKRWLKFENFLEDMGEKPKGLTLDRIRNEGNYEPGNCKWSTYKEQRANQRPR